MGKQIICSKCNRIIGRAATDDAYLVIGDAWFYDTVRFSCRCGKPIVFKAKNFSIGGFDKETRKVLHNLGSRKKFLEQKKPKGKGKDNGNENN